MMLAMLRSAIIALTTLALPAQAAEQIGAWTVESKTDAMTDVTDISGQVASDDGNALLSFSCFDARGAAPYVFMVVFNDFLGSSSSVVRRGSRKIMFRIDDEPAESVFWYYTDKAAHSWTMAEVSEFGNILRRGDRLLVRAFTYRGYSVEASFGVAGASEMIDRVKFLCGKP